jgi:hypothetical protein
VGSAGGRAAFPRNHNKSREEYVHKDRFAELAGFVRKVQLEMMQRWNATPELAPAEGHILRDHFGSGRDSVAAASEIVRARRRGPLNAGATAPV